MTLTSRVAAGMLCALAACAAPSQDVSQTTPSWTAVLRLTRERQFFALRRLLQAADTDKPAARFGRAFVEHAFNHPEASNATIGALIETGTLADSLVARLRQLQLDNDMRLFDYQAGLSAADALLADASTLDSAEVADAQNFRRVFRALLGVRPQTAEIKEETHLQFGHGRIPVRVNDSLRNYVFDTGANLSTIMRSEAEMLGLHIHAAGIDVGTATDRRVSADLGVADLVAIGRMTFRNVVFLVLDDDLLTFPGGFRIPGIIGFPVIQQMGEIHLRGTQDVYVPEKPPIRQQRNLALNGLTLLTPVQWNGVTLLCRLDTGAQMTQMYEPLYRRARARIDSVSRLLRRTFGGAGGSRTVPARALAGIHLTVGDTTVTVDSVDVLTQSIVRNDRDNYLDCNIGHDILDAFSQYILDFRDMAFLLR